jgi:hypothetical protein
MSQRFIESIGAYIQAYDDSARQKRHHAHGFFCHTESPWLMHHAYRNHYTIEHTETITNLRAHSQHVLTRYPVVPCSIAVNGVHAVLLCATLLRVNPTKPLDQFVSLLYRRKSGVSNTITNGIRMHCTEIVDALKKAWGLLKDFIVTFFTSPFITVGAIKRKLPYNSNFRLTDTLTVVLSRINVVDLLNVDKNPFWSDTLHAAIWKYGAPTLDTLGLTRECNNHKATQLAMEWIAIPTELASITSTPVSPANPVLFKWIGALWTSSLKTTFVEIVHFCWREADTRSRRMHLYKENINATYKPSGVVVGVFAEKVHAILTNHNLRATQTNVNLPWPSWPCLCSGADTEIAAPCRECAMAAMQSFWPTSPASNAWCTWMDTYPPGEPRAALDHQAMQLRARVVLISKKVASAIAVHNAICTLSEGTHTQNRLLSATQWLTEAAATLDAMGDTNLRNACHTVRTAASTVNQESYTIQMDGFCVPEESKRKLLDAVHEFMLLAEEVVYTIGEETLVSFLVIFVLRVCLCLRDDPECQTIYDDQLVDLPWMDGVTRQIGDAWTLCATGLQTNPYIELRATRKTDQDLVLTSRLDTTAGIEAMTTHPGMLYWCGALYDTPWDSIEAGTTLISSVMMGLSDDRANHKLYSDNNVPSPTWVADIQAMLVAWMKKTNKKYKTRATLKTIALFALLWGRFDALCVMRKGHRVYPINTQQVLRYDTNISGSTSV